jgi:hypothetical protein
MRRAPASGVALAQRLNSAACTRPPRGGCRAWSFPTLTARAQGSAGCSMQRAPARGVALAQGLGFCCAQAPAPGRLQARSFPTFGSRSMHRAPACGSLLHEDLYSAAARAHPRAVVGTELSHVDHRACAGQWRGSMQQAPACGVARAKRLGFGCAPAAALGRLQARSFPHFSARAQENDRCSLRRAPACGSLLQRDFGFAAHRQPP